MNPFGLAQAGTKTGRKIGGVVGSNLGSYTAELGGKVYMVFVSCQWLIRCFRHLS